MRVSFLTPSFFSVHYFFNNKAGVLEINAGVFENKMGVLCNKQGLLCEKRKRLKR